MTRFQIAYCTLGVILLVAGALFAVSLVTGSAPPEADLTPPTETYVASAIVNQLKTTEGVSNPLASCARKGSEYGCSFSAVLPSGLTQCWTVTLTWIGSDDFKTSGPKESTCPEWMSPGSSGFGVPTTR